MNRRRIRSWAENRISARRPVGTDGDRELSKTRDEPKSVTERAWSGVALIVVALILFNTDWSAIGFIPLIAAVYQFVVAAIAQGVSEGSRSRDE